MSSNTNGQSAPSTTNGAAPKKVRRPVGIGDVIADWRVKGRLIHEPTGIAELDELTGGGPVYGTRWYIAGAPDAGKTAFILHVANVFAARGVTVGLLAVDEDPDDLVTRLAQRAGYSRQHCEIRDPLMLDDIEAALKGLPIRMYDADWTIEDAAADLAALAKERAAADPKSHPHGPRAMLGIDSLQTVNCAADHMASTTAREISEVSAVTARVRAIRRVTTDYKFITFCASELNRGAYRSGDPSQQTATMAGGKWSGAIEYSARVLLGLRSVAGQTDLVEIEYAKNKQWPAGRPRPDAEFRTYLRLDRASQSLWQVQHDAPPKPTEADRDAKAKDKVTADAIVVARLLEEHPGIGTVDLRSEAMTASTLGVERVGAALARLGKGVIRGTGPHGGKPMSLDRNQLPDDIRQALGGSK